MKVALVHDYLIEFGGAERVLVALHKAFPAAPVFVSLANLEKMGADWRQFERMNIKQSLFGRLPFAAQLISPLRFLLPFIWASFDFSDFDVVITSASWAVTKGMKKGKKTKEFCYLHTPPRYLYGYDTSKKWSGKLVKKLVSFYGLIVNHFMRRYDYSQAQKVDYFIANSKNTGKRITKFYRRPFKVIYPPIDLEKILAYKPKVKKENYFLTGGRMVASKNFDLVIKAARRAKVNLKVFGAGGQEEYLRKIAGGSKLIEFLGRVSDPTLFSLCRRAQAFILAQRDEDFGITPVEAAAAGCPIIAFRGGGYLETVVEKKTGIFFEKLEVGDIVKAIKRIKGAKIDPQACVRHAKTFPSQKEFISQIKSFIKSHA